MPLPNEVAASVDDVRAALTRMENLAEAHSSKQSARIKDLTRGEGEAKDALEKALDDVAREREAQAVAEARIERLEEKLQHKRDEIKELQDELEKAEAKLEKKRKENRDLEARVASVEAKLSKIAGVGGGGGGILKERVRSRSPSAPRGKRSKSRSKSRKGSLPKETPRKKERDVRFPGGRSDVKDRGCSRSMSVASSRGSQKVRGRRSRSRSVSTRSRGGRRRPVASRDQGKDRDRGGRSRSNSRSYSRGRSRSHRRNGGGSGAKVDGNAPLCIPFVTSSCRRGDKCRDRHPDKEDCRTILDSLQRKSCRYAADCKRKDCIFKHPEDRKI